jgi:hypothetical protein
MCAITLLDWREYSFRIYGSMSGRVKVAYMFLTTALALSLSFTAETSPEDFPDKPYTLKTEGTTTQVKTGEQGKFALQIIPAKGFKVSREAPMKIKLKSKGLKLEKSRLGQKDTDDKKAKSPKFNVGFGAPSSGKQSVDAHAVFFICNETICQRKVEKLKVAVNVTP